MNSDCKNLDAYLVDDLPAEEAARFAEHLHACDDCRDVIDQQQWIRGLLRSPVRLQLEPAPPSIVQATQMSLARHDRRWTRILVGAIAAAAAVLVAVGWIELNRQASEETIKGAGRVGLATSENSRVIERPRATFVSNSDAIAVPVASRHPNVTVVRVYPTYHPPYETSTAALEPEAATNVSWQSFSNGG